MGLLRLSTVDKIVDYTTKLIIIHHLIHQQPRPTSRGWRFAEAHSITPTSQWKPWSRTVIKSPPFTKFCLLSPLSSVVDMSLQPSVPPFRSIALSLYTNSWLLLLLFTLSSVQPLSCFQLFVTPWTAVHQASLSITKTRLYSNSCPLSWWCHPTISSSGIPFSHLQSFPALGSFPVSWFFTSGGQSIGVSASATVLPMNTQDWSPLGWTGWLSLQSKGLSRVFFNTAVEKHQYFSAQLSL